MISSAKQLKREAKSILFGNYRIFLFATLFFAALLFGFVLVSQSFCELLCIELAAPDEVFFMVSLTLDIICFIVCFPVFCGYVSVCADICRGRECELSQLFGFYSSGTKLISCYAFMLKLILSAFLRLAFPVILFYAVTSYAAKLSEDIFTSVPQSIIKILPALVFIVQALITVIAFYLSGKPLLSVIDFCSGKSRKYKASDIRHFFILRLSFVPLYILSLLTFGVLFICYSLPLTLIVYSNFASGFETGHADVQMKDNSVNTRLFDSSVKGTNPPN